MATMEQMRDKVREFLRTMVPEEHLLEDGDAIQVTLPDRVSRIEETHLAKHIGQLQSLDDQKAFDRAVWKLLEEVLNSDSPRSLLKDAQDWWHAQLYFVPFVPYIAKDPVVKGPRILHPRYDESHWAKLHPFPQWDGDVHQESCVITQIEQTRRRIWPDLATSDEGVPCDMFAWKWGPPPHPALTKIGGVPYRPADRPWPLDENGKPMGYIIQINFSESLDILPALPGNLLIVFAQENCDSHGMCHDYLFPDVAMEWYNIEEISEPMTTAIRTGMTYVPIHGVIYRGRDFPLRDESYLTQMRPDEQKLWEEVSKDNPIYEYSGEFDGDPPAVFPTIKIGGYPSWYQGHDCGVKHQGEFLCQIVSHIFQAGGHYIDEPDTVKTYEDFSKVGDSFFIHGGGTLYLFLDGTRIHWSGQCS